MLFIHDFGVILHIAAGALALLVFWIPVLTKKGGRSHRRTGQVFTSTMYAVSISGILISGLDLLFPLTIHAADIQLTEAEAQAARREVRIFAHFLLSLSILVLTATRQGWLAVLHKQDRSAMRQPTQLTLCASLVMVGATLLISGVMNQRILMLVFGGLEVVSGTASLRYIYKEHLAPNDWLTEHFGGLIGSGIGAYTAFAVFGGRTLFETLFADSLANVTIVLWLAPGIIGGFAIRHLTRRYRKSAGATAGRTAASALTES